MKILMSLGAGKFLGGGPPLITPAISSTSKFILVLPWPRNSEQHSPPREGILKLRLMQSD